MCSSERVKALLLELNNCHELRISDFLIYKAAKNIGAAFELGESRRSYRNPEAGTPTENLKPEIRTARPKNIHTSDR